MENGSAYTAKEWISSKMKVLDEDGVLAVLAERGIPEDMPFSELSQRERDLLMAEGLLSQILLCGTGITVKDTDGNWSHSEGGWQITKADKAAWENLYVRLRRKWGEDAMVSGTSIKLNAHGMRTWHTR